MSKPVTSAPSDNKENLQTLVLTTVDKDGLIQDSANLTGVNQSELLGVLNSLQSKDIIKYTSIVKETFILTEEGSEQAEGGSWEVRLFNAVPPAPETIDAKSLLTKLGKNGALGQKKVLQRKWLKLDAGNFVRLVESVEDITQNILKEIVATGTYSDQKVLQEFKRNKQIKLVKTTTFKVEKGPEFTLTPKQEATDITAEMLANGSWKDLSFKKYNFNALGAPVVSGGLHPLLKVRQQYRQIFLELGFSEMPTNKYVESSFWNFDTLFQPQQHPARDAHDTFFLSDPATTDSFPEDYLERVRKIHSSGGHGSIGYGYDWKKEEAAKLILRTHTTAVSSNELYKAAQRYKDTGVWEPLKLFSIDKVFRNETLDATHLAEFHQIEGLVADRGLTLGDLIGILHGFFKKLGIEKLQFKPAYNPYTEPSMEIFSWHEGLNKWVEIGNSGMFRPEMLLPLGLPEDVTVIAWGLSTERPTMIKYGYDNIRELVGHKCDISKSTL